MASREGEFLGDIECGGTNSEEEGSKEFVSRGKKALSRGCSGALGYNHDGMVSGGSHIYPDVHNFSKATDNIGGRRVELVIDRDSGGEEYRDLVALLEKRSNSSKKPSLKKASKPPRPPKGPTLSHADLKLVKELSELAARKRERIERMKAFRKRKESKRSSSSSNLIALVISILFFLVIILQGVLSRNNNGREFPGSPAPAIAGEGLISIHLFSCAPANEIITSISPRYSSLGQASGSSVQGEEGDNSGHKALVKTIRKLNLTLSLFGR
ncbi:hypothetical protein Cgig2_022156 [Carnegiea gigantea]|uniref:Transmembrane protein n=1 Tax=Carnegiea gigantea TaxID=171969 RepID=A0A9Q1JG50_9CARY|nr:hypothetical protein Cgig2_022156 [Carnegiea gigantea]